MEHVVQSLTRQRLGREADEIRARAGTGRRWRWRAAVASNALQSLRQFSLHAATSPRIDKKGKRP
jgi:hypothetical protein